jgi:hypothetical protein
VHRCYTRRPFQSEYNCDFNCEPVQYRDEDRVHVWGTMQLAQGLECLLGSATTAGTTRRADRATWRRLIRATFVSYAFLAR